MPARSSSSSLPARLNLIPPPPASPSQFGALPETTQHSAAERRQPHTTHHSYPTTQSSNTTSSMPAANTSEPMQRPYSRPVLPVERDQILTVDSFKDEVKMRLAWLDDEIKLLEMREQWWNTRFSDRARRNRERKKLDKLEQDLRAKWDHIFFVTRYKEMSERYGKEGLMDEYERYGSAHESMQQAIGNHPTDVSQ